MEPIIESASPKKTENIVRKLEKQIEEQSKQINQLLALLASQNAPRTSSQQSDMVTIVHLVQRAEGLATYMKLSNLEISMSDFGEERTVTRQQFEEMIGKYRHWFNSGMLSVGVGHEDAAQRYGLKTAKDYPISSDFVKNLGTIEMQALENIFSKLPVEGKAFIIGYWKRKIIANDPLFKDIRKIETLNRLCGGELRQTIEELSAEKKNS